MRGRLSQSFVLNKRIHYDITDEIIAKVGVYASVFQEKL